ncbi:DNA-binding protein [Paenibacillus sp. MMO-177]|uniref:DNA-binding protein n=1 Tax=Paenibacillus sp. MMO-177 TaxID=3081289 RepID=UPI00301B288F
MDQVNDLPAKLSKPAKRAFAQAGYLKLEQFAGLTEAEVLALHGVGPTAIVLLRQALAEKGLAFRN